LRLKTGWLLFGQLLWRKIFYFQFFLLDEWTTYFTSFPWTPSTPNSNSVWARGEFLLKTSIKLIFHVFSKELLHAAMWLKLPKGWRAGSTWHNLQCHCYDLNVKFLIFFKNFNKVHNIEVCSQDPINKNNSSSLILTNLELQFEPCMLNLIWKWGAKDPKKREDHLIFINFGVKKFTLNNTPQKKTLTFECYNLLDPMEWGGVIFGGWCSTR
jgi:hypothetical protein